MKDLKLTERHIFKVFWWLPDNPEKKVAGIVTYIPNEKICLELIGGFEDSSGEYVNLLEETVHRFQLYMERIPTLK